MDDRRVMPSSTTMVTYNGAYFDFCHPDNSAITPRNIAASLSKLCRFTGHTRVFYSVAQHLWLASYLVPSEDALEALMHDAAEAYIGDVSAPLKRLLPDYQVIETCVEKAIATRFGLRYPWPDSIRKIDLQLLKRERKDLLPADEYEWPDLVGVADLAYRIDPWTSDHAEYLWTLRFHTLHDAKDVSDV